jgi:RimJ/RimL family protein N-acetyltransferase
MRISLKPPNRSLQTQLQTERFMLRPVRLFELVGDPHGWRTNPRIYREIYMRPGPMTFGQWLKDGPFPDGERRFTHAIIHRETGRTIGYHRVRLRGTTTGSNQAGIHDEAWLGKDVVVEVRARIMNHFFRHGVERFTAGIYETNHPSIFNYRKLGFRFVGTGIGVRPKPETGQPQGILRFEMLKDDWKRTRFAEPDL